MAKNCSGVLVGRLLGNLNKLRKSSSSCLSGHPYKLLVSNSMQTLARTSIPNTETLIPPNIPSPSKSLSYYSLHSANFRFLQHRRISLPQASEPGNVRFIRTHDEYYSTLKEVVVDKRSQALFYFCAPTCQASLGSIDPVLPWWSDLFSYITIYKVFMDQIGDGCTLDGLNIYKTPTFHFYLKGEKVCELFGDDALRTEYILYRISNADLCETRTTQPTRSSFGMRKTRRRRRRVVMKDKNDERVGLSQHAEAVESRSPATSVPMAKRESD